MKLVFFSGERREVERVGQELATAGIPCEVRGCMVWERTNRNPPGAELWILNDSDCSMAFLVCVRAGVGLGKPKPPGLKRIAETRLWWLEMAEQMARGRS